MPDYTTAAGILARLKKRYGQPQWLGFDELVVSTSYTRGLQRIDYWTMNTYPSKGYHRIAFEIKISRGDFTRELRTPWKRRPALLLANEFYFVAPSGIVPPAKLPIDAGLIELKDNGGMRVTSPAPWIDTEPPSWGFVAALIRRVTNLEAAEEPARSDELSRLCSPLIAQSSKPPNP